MLRRVGHVRPHLHTGLQVRRHQRLRGPAHRAVGNVLSDPGHGGRPRDKMHELKRLGQPGRPGHDAHGAGIEDLSVPDDHEGLILQHLGIEDSPVVRRTHDDLAVGEHLRRLGARFPPDDLILDGIEPAECPGEALLGVQHGVNVFDRHTVGHEREFQVHLRRAAHAPPTRKTFQVEEIADRFRLLAGNVVRVVCVHGGVEERSGAALAERFRIVVLLGAGPVRARRQVREIDELQQALVATANGVGQLQVHHVPVHGPRLDLSANLGEASVVGLEPDFNPGLFRKRLVVRLLAGAGVGASPGHHGDGLWRQWGAREKERQCRCQRRNRTRVRILHELVSSPGPHCRGPQVRYAPTSEGTRANPETPLRRDRAHTRNPSHRRSRDPARCHVPPPARIPGTVGCGTDTRAG